MNGPPENSSRQLRAAFAIAAGVTLLWMASLFPLLSFAVSNNRLVEAFMYGRQDRLAELLAERGARRGGARCP